ncbi:hypothetical protein GOBAR_AA21621 [Gossypium barbadense]|uniref:Phospholipase A1 n=1 Tax=Gossypium barbadense TaxID=3634 RepID=A0A2P5X6S0_GOSBA|nr:hypothetical protein GOBAR_AA21621 [Gossypium barbadense]
MIGSVGDTDSTSIPPPKYLPAEYLDENIQVEEELEIYAGPKGYKRRNYTSEEEELEIGTTILGFMDELMDNLGELFVAHSLDIYLHGVAGVQEDGFRLDYDHDIALVNKHLDWLKEDYKIPGQWWRNENKKYMIQMDNGHWKFVDHS